MDLQTFQAAKKLNDQREQCLELIKMVEARNHWDVLPVEVANCRLNPKYLPLQGHQIATLYVDNIKREIERLELELSKL